ncbi:MAG: hypothetical protein K2X66_01810 [Cyanobacteria bacterium]|nr:hypothetical protein [Cyanobacteriota bacterium]
MNINPVKFGAMLQLAPGTTLNDAKRLADAYGKASKGDRCAYSETSNGTISFCTGNDAFLLNALCETKVGTIV